MTDDIPATMKMLQNMIVPELGVKYAEVFGEPTRVKHKQYLIKRIVWRMPPQRRRVAISSPQTRR